MFDDQLKNSGNQVPGSPPPNLPFAEPDDMLASVDPVQNQPVTPVPPSAAPEVSPALESVSTAAPTALTAGVLKPASSSAPQPTVDEFSPIPIAPTPGPIATLTPNSTASVDSTVPVPHRVVQPDPIQTPPEIPRDADYAVKGPSLSRGIMTLFIVGVIVLILAGGGFWVYRQITASSAPQPAVVPTTTVDTQLQTPPAQNVPIETDVDPLDGSATNVDDQVLFGAPFDSDGDGLDDDRETELGLDPDNWDTDGDNLSDGDEVLIWKTDPQNVDTDGDSYIDGTEVKSGYNPNGVGRIFAAPSQDDEEDVPAAPDLDPVPSTTTISASDFGLPFTELGTCDQQQLNGLVLEAIESLQAQGIVVDEQVSQNPEVFAQLTAEMEEKIRVCGVGPTESNQ